MGALARLVSARGMLVVLGAKRLVSARGLPVVLEARRLDSGLCTTAAAAAAAAAAGEREPVPVIVTTIGASVGKSHCWWLREEGEG